MPNGFHGERNDWDRMEAPLLLIDNVFEAFSKANGMRIRRNYHNWPERSLIWKTANSEKLIQLGLHDEKKLHFNLWICAYEDRGKKRFWKKETLREAVTIEEISSELERLLTQSKAILDSWKTTDLEPVKAPYGAEERR